MKFIKRLVLFGLFAAVCCGALWLWQSPYFALWKINEGLAARDPVRVEEYADLEAFVKATAEVAGALATQEIGVGGDDLGSKILGSLVGTVAKAVGENVAVRGANELRVAIREGHVEKAIGPFKVKDGFAALGAVSMIERSATVTLNGSCKQQDATLTLVFEQRDGPTFGYPKKWVLWGVDTDSAKILAKTCS